MVEENVQIWGKGADTMVEPANKIKRKHMIELKSS